MKKYFYFLSFILLATLGCSNKVQEIEDLIQNKNYTEAQTILNNLSTEEKQKPRIKELQIIINFNNLLDTLSYTAHANNFILPDSLVDASILNYVVYPNLEDSILIMQKHYAFMGANFYYSQKKITQAYQCIIKYVSDNSLNESDKQLVNNLKSNVISGIWAGKMIAGKMKVRMRIDPVGHSAFTGRVVFEEMGILSELYNGVFDGVNLSATYPINVTRYRRVMEGVSGTYNNGTLKMTFPVVVTNTHSESDGGGGVFTSYESKIVRKDCIMSRTK